VYLAFPGTVTSGLEPSLAAVLPTLGKRGRWVFFGSRVEPRRRIAKAFTDIIAPQPRLPRSTLPQQEFFLYAGRSAEFTSRVAPPFFEKESFEALARTVAEPRPDEMKQLVRQDQSKRSAVRQQCAFENDSPLSKETGGVHG